MADPGPEWLLWAHQMKTKHHGLLKEVRQMRESAAAATELLEQFQDLTASHNTHHDRLTVLEGERQLLLSTNEAMDRKCANRNEDTTRSVGQLSTDLTAINKRTTQSEILLAEKVVDDKRLRKEIDDIKSQFNELKSHLGQRGWYNPKHLIDVLLTIFLVINTPSRAFRVCAQATVPSSQSPNPPQSAPIEPGASLSHVPDSSQGCYRQPGNRSGHNHLDSSYEAESIDAIHSKNDQQSWMTTATYPSRGSLLPRADQDVLQPSNNDGITASIVSNRSKSQVSVDWLDEDKDGFSIKPQGLLDPEEHLVENADAIVSSIECFEMRKTRQFVESLRDGKQRAEITQILENKGWRWKIAYQEFLAMAQRNKKRRREDPEEEIIGSSSGSIGQRIKAMRRSGKSGRSIHSKA